MALTITFFILCLLAVIGALIMQIWIYKSKTQEQEDFANYFSHMGFITAAVFFTLTLISCFRV